MSEAQRPRWTLLYNIRCAGSPWIGTGWEFFDDHEAAERRRSQIPSEPPTDYSGPVCGTLRPYYEGVDYPRLGAAHRM